MGESLVEVPKVENKMDESCAHVPCLQESVSFGRFEHDSLCWERWSTFPTNKYLEEVEKFSTPGSVAQKKAYFEAHYKRIAARKAELLELEQNREAEFEDSEDRTPSSLVCSTGEEDLDVEKPTTRNYVELDEVGNFTGEVSDKHIDVLSSSDDKLIQENEGANLTSGVSENVEGNEVVNLTSVAVRENFEENGVVNLTSEFSENFEENGLANQTSEFSDNFAENEVVDLANEFSDDFDESSDVVDAITDEVADFTGEVNDHVDELNGEAGVAEEKKNIQLEVHNGADVVKESQDVHPKPEDVNEDLGMKMEIPVLVKPDEPVLVKEDVTSAKVWHDKEVLPQEKAEEREITNEESPKPVKLVDPVKTKKTTLVKKATTNTTNANRKPAPSIPKRPVASMPKSSTISTPKSSKPELTKTAKSTTRPSVKKENVQTPVTSKKAARPESKKVLPTSLHMSFSYGPTKSDPASLTTVRKSLIMERMGDKEIVKRAFKSFQNVSQLSPSSLAKPTATNQPATRTEPKPSAPGTPEKKKEGSIRSAKVTSAVISQQGTKKTLQSPGLKKNIGVDQRNVKAVPASFGSRSQDLGRQQKPAPKKIEQKATINDAGMINLQPKSKAEKAAEIGKPIQKSNSKPKLSSSYNQGHGFLRGSVRKVAAKT